MMLDAIDVVRTAMPIIAGISPVWVFPAMMGALVLSVPHWAITDRSY